MKRAYNPLIDDIKREYEVHRKNGKTREESVIHIRDDYADAMEDDEDKLAILIGLCLGLCKKSELYDDLAQETLNEMHRILNENWDKDDGDYKVVASYCASFEEYLKTEPVYGGEAVYRPSKKYLPDWQVGDLFSHIMTHSRAEELGIQGWYILFYKVGEYIDRFDEHRQLMFLSVCPPDKVPTCEDDFLKLQFLPVMPRYDGDQFEYMGQITIKSKRKENEYALTKIGHFSKFTLPNDYVPVNPLVSMPLFGKSKWDGGALGYEGQVCNFYRDYGKRFDFLK